MGQIKQTIALLVLAGLFGLTQCTHDIPQPNSLPEGGGDAATLCDPDTVYFEQDILPILISSCAMPGCHDAASHEDGIILDSYVNLMFGDDDNLIIPGDLNESEVYDVITEDDPDKMMPPPSENPLTSSQITAISNWIMQGALNNSCSDCNSSNFTYAEVIAPMMETNCTACHSGTNPDAGLDLSNHSGVSTAASYLNLFARVSHQIGFDPMPPSGDGLSDCQISQIESWINAGMPNN